MNKYKVTLTYQYTQEVEVYAENQGQALHIASQCDEGINWDDKIMDWSAVLVDTENEQC